MRTLAGRTAFVTGGAQGIGLGLVRALLAEGMRVAVTDVDDSRLHEGLASLEGGGEVAGWVLDVRDRERFAAVADEAEDLLGPVWLLCSNAGVLDSASPARMNYAQWDASIGINLGGVYNGIQTFLPRMIRRGEGGHLLNTSSEAGVVVEKGGFLYHASKYAVVGLSESLRYELVHHRIGVTVMCPGPVDTGIIDNSRALRPDGAPALSTRAHEIVEGTRQWLRDGLTTDQLAALAIDAVRHDKPYVFTRPELGDLLRARHEQMLRHVPS